MGVYCAVWPLDARESDRTEYGSAFLTSRDRCLSSSYSAKTRGELEEKAMYDSVLGLKPFDSQPAATPIEIVISPQDFSHSCTL